MWIDITLGGLLVLAVGLLLVLFWRKLPFARSTDPAQAAKFEQQRVKSSLMEARLRRKLASQTQRAMVPFKPFVSLVANALTILTDYMRMWERKAEEQLREEQNPRRNAVELLAQASNALGREDYREAEHLYLEVLRLDPHRLEAYQGLGEIYLSRRDFEEAKEVFEYLAKRGSRSASVLGLARVASGQGNLEEARGRYMSVLDQANAVQPRLELAKILRELGNLEEAISQVAAARAIEPNNPKILDLFIELSILYGRADYAREALTWLQQVNPENQKIAELDRQIRKLEQASRKPSVRGAKKSNFGLTL